MLKKIKKELNRITKKLFRSGKKYEQLERLQHERENLPYETFDNSDCSIRIPHIKTIDETLEKILLENCSIARFGDGEFGVMTGSRIHFQNRSTKMAQRLKEVIASNNPNFLVALVDTFGTLENHLQPGKDFWRKWMSKKRQIVYSYLDMDRVYYNALFSRPYVIFNKTDEHYNNCHIYFEKMKKIWADRDVVICEGEGTRFGLFNDLLGGAKSISRILCPARSAFDKYDEILSAFNGVSKEKLVLAALGPTATVLAYDLCNKGYQAIDIGHLDLEYEWFLRKSLTGVPLKFKYVDGTAEGRKVHPLEDPEYKKQIIKTVL
ncbi:MAG TPA: SP_1767 family glycosyltransferase [Sedimentisphaerales bacterium]|nr:SP_1767 family glycosyltransferase [Sedimentisphaerales bacterium]